MTDQIATFDLPAVMKAEDCQELDTFLRAHHDQTVILNCNAVTRVGGQAAQLIAAHMKFRKGDNCELTLQTPSEGFVAGLQTMGLLEIITAESAAA